MVHGRAVLLSCPAKGNKFPIHYWISKDFCSTNSTYIFHGEKWWKNLLFQEGRIVHLPIKCFIVTLGKIRWMQFELMRLNSAKTDLAQRVLASDWFPASVLKLSLKHLEEQSLGRLYLYICKETRVRHVIAHHTPYLNLW